MKIAAWACPALGLRSCLACEFCRPRPIEFLQRLAAISSGNHARPFRESSQGSDEQPTSRPTPPQLLSSHETSLMFQLAYSSNAYMNFSVEETIRRIAALGFDGLELLSDVPHAWPAGLLEERKQAIRDCLAENGLQISNINGFMMNAVADPQATLLAPVVDRTGCQLSGDSPGTYEAGPPAGPRTGGTGDPDRAGRPTQSGPDMAPGCRGLLRRIHAVRGGCRDGRGPAADRTRAGPD